MRKSMYFSIRRPRFGHGSFDNSWYKNGHYLHLPGPQFLILNSQNLNFHILRVETRRSISFLLKLSAVLERGSTERCLRIAKRTLLLISPRKIFSSVSFFLMLFVNEVVFLLSFLSVDCHFIRLQLFLYIEIE